MVYSMEGPRRRDPVRNRAEQQKKTESQNHEDPWEKARMDLIDGGFFGADNRVTDEGVEALHKQGWSDEQIRAVEDMQANQNGEVIQIQSSERIKDIGSMSARDRSRISAEAQVRAQEALAQRGRDEQIRNAEVARMRAELRAIDQATSNGLSRDAAMRAGQDAGRRFDSNQRAA